MPACMCGNKSGRFDLRRGRQEIGEKAKKTKQLFEAVAAGKSHICKGSTCNNDQMQHGHMADALPSAHGSFEAWTRGKDDAQGTRQWRRRRRAWPEVTTGRIKPSGKISGGLQQRRRFCLFMCQYIYSGYTGA